MTKKTYLALTMTSETALPFKAGTTVLNLKREKREKNIRIKFVLFRETSTVIFVSNKVPFICRDVVFIQEYQES